MRIALIGGGGRVGTWITPWLRRRHEVVVLDREPGEGVVVVDALDRGALSRSLVGTDAAVHLGVVVPRGSEVDDPGVVGAAWSINVGSVAQTVLACADAHVRRVIHASSLSVYRDAGRHLIPRDESPNSHCTYGLSKRVAETMLGMLAKELGLDITSLRLGWPTPDDMAPRWLDPGTGRDLTVRLKDGRVIPALPGRAVAEAIEDEISRPVASGHRSRNLVADPSTVFSG